MDDPPVTRSSSKRVLDAETHAKNGVSESGAPVTEPPLKRHRSDADEHGAEDHKENGHGDAKRALGKKKHAAETAEKKEQTTTAEEVANRALLMLSEAAGGMSGLPRHESNGTKAADSAAHVGNGTASHTTTDGVVVSPPSSEQYNGDQLMTVESAIVSPHPIIAGQNSVWTLTVRINEAIARASYAEMRLWKPIRFPLPTIQLKDATEWDFQSTSEPIVLTATIKPPLPAALTPAGKYVASVDIVDPTREKGKQRVGSTNIAFRVSKP